MEGEGWGRDGDGGGRREEQGSKGARERGSEEEGGVRLTVVVVDLVDLIREEE